MPPRENLALARFFDPRSTRGDPRTLYGSAGVHSDADQFDQLRIDVVDHVTLCLDVGISLVCHHDFFAVGRAPGPVTQSPRTRVVYWIQTAVTATGSGGRSQIAA